MKQDNIDIKTVKGFGAEWARYDQKALGNSERQELFNRYFRIFPWHVLPIDAVGFDLGCGSGRWAFLVAPRVGRLHCIDASESAINVARENLANCQNCEFHVASVDQLPLAPGSMDFGYSLGVLHHIPDTQVGIQSCVDVLKTGAPFLLYLYYAFDNRPWWFRLLWRMTDFARRIISVSPILVRHRITQIIAALIYYPLARLSYAFERMGLNVEFLPLSSYRRRSFYVMCTDALDRFGTKLERRFTAAAIRRMMERAGLERIAFSNSVPFWCAIGFKK
jgi:ubiquinone/menaquinone biosynthesis C-methylase UbiE